MKILNFNTTMAFNTYVEPEPDFFAETTIARSIKVSELNLVSGDKIKMRVIENNTGEEITIRFKIGAINGSVKTEQGFGITPRLTDIGSELVVIVSSETIDNIDVYNTSSTGVDQTKKIAFWRVD